MKPAVTTEPATPHRHQGTSIMRNPAGGTANSRRATNKRSRSQTRARATIAGTA